MKTYYTRLFLSLALVFGLIDVAHAALIPSITLTTNSGNNTVQIATFGADPNASVMFYYPSTSGYQSVNLGTTNGSGSLNTSIGLTTYSINAGSPVYVMVDGQPSQSAAWPSAVVSSATLPLSQTTLTMNIGQTAVITAPVSATLSMTNNTNPSAAGVSINGNSITVSAFAYGATNITICGGNIGCGVIVITVLSNTSNQTAVTFNQTPVTVSVGQSQAVQINGTAPFYVSTNSNTGVATAIVSGSTLTVGGISAGSTNLSICSSASNSTTCNTLPVIVTPISANTTATTSITFGQNEIDIALGQSQTVPIHGGTSNSYILSGNSSPSNVTASITNGNTLNVTGVAFGSSNISVCQSDNSSCGTIYVYVQANSTGGTVPTASNSSQLALTSFSVSSNNAAGTFAGTGSRLTLTMSANQTISTPSVSVGGTSIAITGNTSGPYTGTYTITGFEAQPIPIVVAFTNPAGTGIQSYFYVSNSNKSSSASAQSSGTSQTTTSPSSATFARQLNVGSVGSDVTALQIRLKADGYFSGSVTGTYGSVTAAAVKKYQTAHHLTAVGPATRNLLNQGL